MNIALFMKNKKKSLHPSSVGSVNPPSLHIKNDEIFYIFFYGWNGEKIVIKIHTAMLAGKKAYF